MGKIGIVTEGHSEIVSLPLLYPQLKDRTGNQFLKPLRATVDPLSPVPVLVRGLAERTRLAFAKGASRVIVVLDRENHADSAATRAQEIELALRRSVSGSVFVVVKDRKYENWLISSPESFEAQRGRFPEHARIRAIQEGGSDGIDDAARLINHACGRSGHYEKVDDASKIMSRANVETMSQNSRSFRRLLAVSGDLKYGRGSRTYIAPS